MSSVGTVKLYRAGVSLINILRPAAFAQRTGKARYALLAPVEPYGMVGHWGLEPETARI